MPHSAHRPPATDAERQLEELQALSERDRRALTSLYNISLASREGMSFQHIFEATYRELQTVFGFDAYYIAICDIDEPKLFRAVLLVDEGVLEYREREGFGTLTGLLVSTRQPLLFRDLAAERKQLALPPDMFGDQQRQSRAWLGVPLLVGSAAVGVISIQSYQPALYDEGDLDLLQHLGNIIAVALENTWLDQQQHALSRALTDQVATRTVELTTLSTIAAELVLQQPLPDLLDRALEHVLPVFGLEAGTIRLLDPRGEALTLIAQRGFSDEYVKLARNLPLADSALGTIVRENRPLVLASELQQQALPRFVSQVPYVSLLGVPLRIGERVLGALSLFGRNEHSFSPQAIDLAQAIGNQIAIAVENARLFAAQQRQIHELDAVGHIGRLISGSFDFDEMLTGVYETLDAVLHPSVFYLLLCEPKTHIVTNAIFIEGGQRIPLDWLGQPPASDSLTATVMQQRAPLLFQDLVDQRDDAHRHGITPHALGPDNAVRSWLGVPLLAQDREPIGVLAVQDYQDNRYDEQTIEFLRQIASHVSLGVQKVRLFTAEQAARRTADTLREVARVLSSSFDSREVLGLILRELQNVIAYDTASIMLAERTSLRVVAARGFDAGVPMHDLANQHGGPEQVVRTGKSLVIPDITQSSNWRPPAAIADIRAWLGVPLVAKGSVLGVLNIAARHANAFSSRDIEVTQAFADHAALALENAQLYEESVTRVEQELEIAHRIQSNLIPRTLPQVAGVEIAARCIPARETGGDFFDIVPLNDAADSDQPLLALIIGDASGKSIPGAMLMAIARSIVRSEARDHRTPQVVMRESNYWIAHDVPSRSFVALCYATLDVARRQLVLGNGGQLTPWRRSAAGHITELEVPGPRLPLGIMADIPYDALHVQLQAGDLLMLFTDGIVEAKNRDRELFGFERLQQLLALHGDLPPRTLIERVLEAIDVFANGTLQHDDMTILAIRV